MNPEFILFPVFALAALTFGMAIWMGRLRFAAVKRGDLNPRYFELNRGGKVPEHLAQVANNYRNLLELPLLFYTASAFLYIADRVDLSYVVLAWLYVSTRYVHSFIHATNNNVRHRSFVFIAGCILLMVIWLRFIFQIVTS